VAGDVELTFDGSVELADGAAVFDGASGFASTSSPGPIDTTASFSVAAWVSLHPPTDAGGMGAQHGGQPARRRDGRLRRQRRLRPVELLDEGR
jgi:hypothetical protein